MTGEDRDEVAQLEAMLARPARAVEGEGRADPYTEADMLELHLWLSLDRPPDPARGRCAVLVTETGDGWAFSCSCGYESKPDLTEVDARWFASLHERA